MCLESLHMDSCREVCFLNPGLPGITLRSSFLHELSLQNFVNCHTVTGLRLDTAFNEFFEAHSAVFKLKHALQLRTDCAAALGLTTFCLIERLETLFGYLTTAYTFLRISRGNQICDNSKCPNVTWLATVLPIQNFFRREYLSLFLVGTETGRAIV